MITSEAVTRLRSFNATHHAQEVALRGLLRSWEMSRTDHRLSLVFGPAGVGKDRLIELASSAIAKRTKGQRPIVVEAPPGVGQAAFSMKSFLALVLAALDDPDPLGHGGLTAAQLREIESNGRSKTGSALLFAVRERLRAFAPSALFLNEANYLAHGTSDRAPTNPRVQANMRGLTWLADTTTVPIALFGTYPALFLPKAGTDVNRRMRLIHFPRYGAAGSGLLHFGSAVARFGDFLAKERIASGDLDLKSRGALRELHGATYGLVGLLSDLLAAAAHIASENGRLLGFPDLHKARDAVLGDPTTFEAELVGGEDRAALAGHGSPYQPVQRREREATPGRGRDDGRAKHGRASPGERRLGRDEAFGILGTREHAA